MTTPSPSPTLLRAPRPDETNEAGAMEHVSAWYDTCLVVCKRPANCRRQFKQLAEAKQVHTCETYGAHRNERGSTVLNAGKAPHNMYVSTAEISTTNHNVLSRSPFRHGNCQVLSSLYKKLCTPIELWVPRRCAYRGKCVQRDLDLVRPSTTSFVFQLPSPRKLRRTTFGRSATNGAMRCPT